MPDVTPILPPRRSLALWAWLLLGMVVCSYLFIIFLAGVCIYLPFQLVSHTEDGMGFQILVLIVCGFLMGGTLLWSLVPRRDKFKPPGPLLDRASHPRLFAELDAIAAALNEPVPSEVYLTHEVNAWVTDRGGVLGWSSRRVMGLGLPLMAILTISEFRAVLAHEFAHYYGGDTRLGPWLYKTRMAMVRTMQNMASIGRYMRWLFAQIAYQVVMWVLKEYWELFFRCTQMISRRQEYRADELACYIGGPQALSEGLKKINSAGASYSSFWMSEVLPMLNSGYRVPISQGFSQFVSASVVAKNIEQYLNKVLQEEKVEPYDSHPPLRDRLAAAQALPMHSVAQDNSLASSLLDNLVKEEFRLLEVATPSLIEKLNFMPWEGVADVLTSNWRNAVKKHALLLGNVTAESLPEALGRAEQLGAKLPDPPGKLLTPLQRTNRAVELLVVAMSLAVIEAGGMLQVKPGESYFLLGGEKLSVGAMVGQLTKKKMTVEAWRERCASLNLPKCRLVDLVQTELNQPI